MTNAQVLAETAGQPQSLNSPGGASPPPSIAAVSVPKARPSLAVCMADVEPEQVEWQWFPYIPKRKLTIIEGDPGIGKSWLTMELAAEVSTGRRMAGCLRGGEPQSVLLLTMEDGAGDTIRPRLDTLKADVSKVHVITKPLALDGTGAGTLKAEIERLNAALVIIDPIVGYLPEKTDMNSASAVRPVMARLAKVAEETDAAIVIVRHFAKSAKDQPLYRGLGSIDFTAAARSVLMVGADPTDAQKRVVAHAKSNLTEKGPSLAYTLKNGKFTWVGRSSLSAEDLGVPPDADLRSAREEAQDFLLQTLAEGPKPQAEVRAEAIKLGIAGATLRRAKGDLRVRAMKKPDHWEWSLPKSAPEGTTSEHEGAQAANCDHLERLGCL
jgi:putative DNA primase/helicase